MISMAGELTTVPPVFLRHQDISEGETRVRAQGGLTPYDICVTVSRLTGIGTVEGAQCPDSNRGCWRIYMKSPHARVQLLARREIRLNGKSVPLYDSNPSVTGQSTPEDPREKVTIKFLPMSVSSTEIENFFTEKGVTLTSTIQYSRERDPDGRLTDFKNGDRYCYAKAPIQPKIQRLARIAGIQCRIFHDGQFNNDCKACQQPGHKAGDTTCQALNTEDNTTAFRSYNMILSNMHASKIDIYGQEFDSVEHAYQWKKATDINAQDTATRIKNALHSGAAKRISKDLPQDLVERWSDSMSTHVKTSLIRAKARQVPAFRDALLDTKDNLAEATYDKVWGTGLSPEHTCKTQPKYWPGANLLGVIMQEVREELRTDLKIDSTSNNHEEAAPRRSRQRSPLNKSAHHRSASTGSYVRAGNKEPITKYFTPRIDRSNRMSSRTQPTDRANKTQRQDQPPHIP